MHSVLKKTTCEVCDSLLNTEPQRISQHTCTGPYFNGWRHKWTAQKVLSKLPREAPRPRFRDLHINESPTQVI